MSLIIKQKNYAKNNPKVIKIALIKSSEKIKKYLYFNTEKFDGDQQITLENKQKFQPVPIKIKNQIERLFISGASGSGKSTYLSNWLKMFRAEKGNKDKTIYLFSSVDYDEIIDENFEDVLIRPLEELDGDDLIQDPLQLKDFDEGSVLIFDDVMKIQDIKARIALQNLMDSMLEIARHGDLTIIATSHILANYKATRTLQNEATSVTIFPKYSGGLYGIKQYLEKKIGMALPQVKKLLSLSKNSRFVTIYRNMSPMVVISEKECYLYDPFEN